MEGWDNAVWTGTEMLTFGPGGTGAYNPVTGTWRPIPGNMLGALGAVRVWTGHQEIFWGGGCCGGALADGAAYTLATNTWQALPRAPLSARYASGVWTGTEMITAGGEFADSTIRAFADAAAYNPVTRTWRKLPPMPEPRWGATAVWDGTEALFIGGTLADAHAPSADGVAFNPATGQWRRLPAMEFSRSSFAVVWTGRQVLTWGGQTGPFQDRKIPPHGVAYDPASNQWSAMPMAPLRGRIESAAVWTGRQMIVWGGTIPARRKTPRLPTGPPTSPAADPQCHARTPHKGLTCCSASGAHVIRLARGLERCHPVMQLSGRPDLPRSGAGPLLWDVRVDAATCAGSPVRREKVSA